VQLLLWGDEQLQPSIPENFIECIHFNGSREIVSTLDTSIDWKDMSVWSAQFVTREKYEEYQKKKREKDATRK
jgi:hypothetical protein